MDPPDLENVFYPFNGTGVNFAIKPINLDTDPGVTSFFSIVYDYQNQNNSFVDLRSCTLDDFPSATHQELTAIGITDYYCIPEITELPIYGAFGSNFFDAFYFSYNVFLCQSDTCDEIPDTLADQAEVDILWTDKIFDS